MRAKTTEGEMHGSGDISGESSTYLLLTVSCIITFYIVCIANFETLHGRVAVDGDVKLSSYDLRPAFILEADYCPC